MGRIRLDTMTQVSKHGYSLVAICRCGNRRTFDPTWLSINYKVRTMDELDRRFRCKLCKGRAWTVQVN